VLLAVGLVLAIALNVSVVRIVDSLWNDQTLREAVVAQSASLSESQCPADKPNCAPEERIENAIQDLKDLRLPVGWGDDWNADGAIWVLLGLIPTAFAVMMGAPFWFDLLGRMAGLRQGRGVPPRAGTDPGSATAGLTGGAAAGVVPLDSVMPRP
jgi:hypothetical protein